jgi:hypothetical protein
MKSTLVLATIFCGQVGFACVQQEAQFIGNVKNFQKVAVDQYIYDCSYQIDFTMFNPSYVCPLVVGEVSMTRFEDLNCSLKNGDQVSGVLIKKDDLVTIE